MELLVVVAIITMLIGVLVPGMRGVTKHARKLKQKAYIHDIEIGIELFREDFGYYPDSDVLTADGVTAPNLVCGAQHLAEAMLGRDDLGFDSRSNWHDTGEDTEVYDDDDLSIQKYRKRMYLELKETGAFTIEQLYPSISSTDLLSGKIVTGTPNNAKDRAPMLTDLYGVRIEGLDYKVGTPIVYFKANTASRLHEDEPDASDTSAVTKTWIYDYYDNADIFELPSVEDPTDPEYTANNYFHHYDEDYTDANGNDGKTLFYQDITNEMVQAMNPKPHNPNTFLLMSAGADHTYGTKDDVTNIK